jgi:hypothetical protein
VQTVAELASRPQNIETLQNAGVMSLLRPLLLDIVPTIQQTAALALGRLANYNDDLAEAVVKGDILPQLVYSLAEQNVSCYAVCLLMNTVKLCILCTPLFPVIVIFVCQIISAVVIAKAGVIRTAQCGNVRENVISTALIREPGNVNEKVVTGCLDNVAISILLIFGTNWLTLEQGVCGRVTEIWKLKHAFTNTDIISTRPAAGTSPGSVETLNP